MSLQQLKHKNLNIDTGDLILIQMFLQCFEFSKFCDEKKLHILTITCIMQSFDFYKCIQFSKYAAVACVLNEINPFLFNYTTSYMILILWKENWMINTWKEFTTFQNKLLRICYFF